MCTVPETKTKRKKKHKHRNLYKHNEVWLSWLYDSWVRLQHPRGRTGISRGNCSQARWLTCFSREQSCSFSNVNLRWWEPVTSSWARLAKSAAPHVENWLSVSSSQTSARQQRNKNKLVINVYEHVLVSLLQSFLIYRSQRWIFAASRLSDLTMQYKPRLPLVWWSGLVQVQPLQAYVKQPSRRWGGFQKKTHRWKLLLDFLSVSQFTLFLLEK